MCGILGYVSATKPISSTQVEMGLAAIAHRGPDASGIFEEKGGRVVLGHRRLSVIDLTETANQPMTSACGRFVIVFNGEVYNFREIRNFLEKEHNVNFQTKGDTEVLLEAWAALGSECIGRVNGMFAFAIWDKIENCLWVGRDRLGIKPFFYRLADGIFYFASELKGVLALLPLQKQLSEEAVNSFLHLGFIPQPNSIYQEIYKLPHGHIGCLKFDGGLELTPYWSYQTLFRKKPEDEPARAKENLKELLISSVSYRMISDVPFGTFLSGGTDSSLITSIAASLSKSPLKTFSIGFENGDFNELHFAREVAKRLRTDHKEFVLSEKDAIDLIEDNLLTFDEPFGDTSAIPTMLVSKLARQDVTVILTGDGGDELFLGYGAYKWSDRLENRAFRIVQPLMGWGFRTLGTSRLQRIGELLGGPIPSERSHIFSQEQYYFTQNEITHLFPGLKLPDFRYKDPNFLPEWMSAAERQAFFDLQVYLPDDLLVKVDRASMKYALECRVPLLDYRIVVETLNYSKGLKWKEGQTKWLLKELLCEYLPPELVYRKKWGFGVPLASWLQKNLSYLLDELIANVASGALPGVNEKAVNNYIREFKAGRKYLAQRLWLLIVLTKWMRNSDEKG